MEKAYFFTARKVMAIAIAIVTMMVGYISLTTLPVEQYPDIAPPTIYVETSYTGADAASVVSSVIMPLEESINGVEHMMYMTSQASSTGDVCIQIFFEQGTDADMATVNVQNRVSKALGLLPAEVTKVGVQVYKSQNSILQIAALKSSDGRFDEDFIANYLDIYVLPRIQRVNGVGKVQSFGNKYALRIWMKPDVLAQYQLEPDDIFAAIGSQNIVAPAGALGEHSSNTYQYTLEYKGRLKSIEEFENIVIRATNDGSLLRLSDVADIELGALNYTFTSSVDKMPGVSFMVNQAAGANATKVNEAINQLYKDMENQLPPGLEFCTIQCSNDFLEAAMDNVIETLVIAIILVVLVVYLFLQSLRATVIPTISIIVSMIGTFAIVKMAGFSLNILTLFALVLAIGTVVDDAIVVVEAVMAKFESGVKHPVQATNQAMHDVFMAVMSCTFVFMAVFIPVTFMPGTSGTFFTQFGITLAAAVGLSGVNALTLCPALCAVMLRPESDNESKKNINYYVKRAYNAAYGSIFNKYSKSVQKFLGRPHWAWISLVAALCLMFWMMSATPSDLVPQEDQGFVLVNITTPPGYTLSQTDEVLKKVEAQIEKYEEVEHISRIAGYGMLSGVDASAGTIFARLKNWKERDGIEHSIDMIMYKIYLDCKSITEAQVVPFQMPQIPGYGTGNSIELNVQNAGGGSMDDFAENVKKLVVALQQRPEIGSVFNSYNNTYPKFKVNIDASLCARSGISIEKVLNVLGSYCGGAYVSNYNQYDKIYRVMASVSPEYRLDPSALDNMFIKVSNGSMAPLSQFVSLTPTVGSAVEKRFNLFPSISLSVDPASGCSASQAMDAIKTTFAEVMPASCSYEYGGMARETAKNAGSNDTVFIYIICIICIYLIMACLYNSWYIPLAVLFSIPFGLMGAFLVTYPLAALGLGFTNNIYLQTGVIMLIGLLSKTAILITEYAVDKHKAGMSIYDAAFGACKDRLRPILMTVACMVIGMIPLVIHGGAGAAGNRSLALGVIGGMVVGTIALIFVVPVFYMFFQKIQDRLDK
ncbi:MAG: efflux RND transporter permease subunit [Prevotellaceae bacterium]|nr:efflux RND transporter permease subunit [Candidatus Colivivens equi]